MTGRDPLPLKAGGEAAPELVSALYALGTPALTASQRERLAEEVARELERRPDPAAPLGLWQRLKRRFARAELREPECLEERPRRPSQLPSIPQRGPAQSG